MRVWRHSGYIHFQIHPHTIEKVEDSPYQYPYPVNVEISIKTETSSNNTYKNEFIYHLSLVQFWCLVLV